MGTIGHTPNAASQLSVPSDQSPLLSLFSTRFRGFIIHHTNSLIALLSYLEIYLVLVGWEGGSYIPILLLVHMMPLTYMIYISIVTKMCRKILIFEI